MAYACGRIRTLGDKLQQSGIDQAAIDRNMAGGEAILASASPERKAA